MKIKKLFLFALLLTVVLIVTSETTLFAQEKLEKESTIIAVPSIRDSINSNICPQFGRAPYFIIYDLSDDSFEVMKNQYVNAGSGAGRGAAQVLVNRNVNVVIAKNCGGNVAGVLQSAKIKIHIVSSGTVEEAIERYKKGEIK